MQQENIAFPLTREHAHTHARASPITTRNEIRTC